MINLTPLDIVNRAEQMLDATARNVSQGRWSAEDVARLLEVKEQVTAAVALSHTQDELNKKIIDVLG